jgi:anti-sigma factor RsiW
MNAHAEEWMDAYLDGMLTPAQLRQAEAHLRACPACHALLEERRSLSALLQSAPTASDLKPERQFVAEVGLQLARHQDPAPAETPGRAFFLRVAWLSVPVGLLLAWVFVQVVSGFSLALQLIPGADAALVQQTSFLGSLGLPLRAAGPVEPLVDALSWLGAFNFFHWGWLTGVVAMVLISVLAASWVAGWWTHAVQEEE